MGAPTATQIGEGASGGLAGALISKIQKTQNTANLGGYSHAKQLADTRFVRFLNAADNLAGLGLRMGGCPVGAGVGAAHRTVCTSHAGPGLC